MPALCVFGSSGHRTKCLLKIKNMTICTFRRTSESSQQMDEWDTNWPLEIRPQSETNIKVVFLTRKSIPFHLDQGEVTYEVMDNVGNVLHIRTQTMSCHVTPHHAPCQP